MEAVSTGKRILPRFFLARRDCTVYNERKQKKRHERAVAAARPEIQGRKRTDERQRVCFRAKEEPGIDRDAYI